MADTSFAYKWFESKNWEVFSFQQESWESYLQGYSGLINAPTGSGKTYSLLIPALIEHHALDFPKGLQLIWVTPIRALAKEINLSSVKAAEGLSIQWEVATRTGDTSTTARQKQLSDPPHMLITTPESLLVLMCQSKYEDFFSTVKAVVVDEWHELVGSKRGVQTELFLSRMRGINPTLKIWGISATIGNMDEAVDVLLGQEKPSPWKVIKADIKKEIEVHSIIPDEIEKFPWAGHLGIRMLQKVVPIIKASRTT